MSVTFVDGPAVGRSLQLRRAPLLLRVTHNRMGEFDALDQPDDFAAPDETLVAYVLTGPPTWAHVRTSRRSGSGRFMIASYRVLSEQPPAHVLRNNRLWKGWTELNAEKLIPEWARGKVVP